MIHHRRDRRALVAGSAAALLALSLLLSPPAGATTQSENAAPGLPVSPLSASPTSSQSATPSSSPSSGPSDEPDDGTPFQLISDDPTLCLTVYNGETYNDAPATVWPCGTMGASQLWLWVGTQLTSKLNGRCLDAYNHSPGKPGTNVYLYDCVGASSQQWLRYGDNQIQQRDTGFCLSILTKTPIQGSIIIADKCAARSGEHWIQKH